MPEDDAQELGSDIEDNASEGEGHVEEEVMYSEMVKQRGSGVDHHDDPLNASQHAILAGTVDAVEWKTELERVGPRLKLKHGRGVTKEEWRTHLEQTKKYEKTIDQSLPLVQKRLAQISAEVQTALERVGAKERHLNGQFEQYGAEYKAIQGRQNEAQETFQVREGGDG